MTSRETLQALRRIQETHKDDFVGTFELRIADMAKDAADAIESLLAFVDMIGELATCNDCGRKRTCEYKPGLGETVRYNCPFYTEMEDETAKANDAVPILYLCDRRACEKCGGECRHTRDIRHAASFEMKHHVFVESDSRDFGAIKSAMELEHDAFMAKIRGQMSNE